VNLSGAEYARKHPRRREGNPISYQRVEKGHSKEQWPRYIDGPCAAALGLDKICTLTLILSIADLILLADNTKNMIL
jgi:hypothetical protein